LFNISSFVSSPSEQGVFLWFGGLFSSYSDHFLSYWNIVTVKQKAKTTYRVKSKNNCKKNKNIFISKMTTTTYYKETFPVLCWHSYNACHLVKLTLQCQQVSENGTFGRWLEHKVNNNVFIFFTIVFTFYPICRLCFLLNCYYISVCNVIREVTVQYVVFFMEDLGENGTFGRWLEHKVNNIVMVI
jgi:hypothetical protein